MARSSPRNASEATPHRSRQENTRQFAGVVPNRCRLDRRFLHKGVLE
ncbi:hypothetical protein [Hydrogenispora ethanolica]|nr:hypothetical protein [Hydrogenispora ethanolica]